MKKYITIVILSALVTLSACKGKKASETGSETNPATTQGESETKTDKTATTTPDTYTVTATPDSASLGKNKEALVHIKDLKAISLFNPDGQTTGMELTYKIELTNKNAIGGVTLYFQTSNCRLELDNGTKISPEPMEVAVDPEATKLSENNKFTLPAGTKPAALHLFYNDTRAVIKLELK